jgi:hypothetical protein
MPDLNSAIEELRARVERLERTPPKPRGRTNQAGAARYLGISDETLRARHAAGKGPPRKRSGTNRWSYSFADLDEYAEQSA